MISKQEKQSEKTCTRRRKTSFSVPYRYGSSSFSSIVGILVDAQASFFSGQMELSRKFILLINDYENTSDR